MLRFLIVWVLVLVAPAVAYAGCTDYGDGDNEQPAPSVVICYNGECSQTKLEYTCGNVHQALYGYNDGWKFAFYAPPQEPSSWARTPDGVELNSTNGVTCYSDQNSDGCPNLLGKDRATPPTPNPAETTRRLEQNPYPKDTQDTRPVYKQPGPLPLPARIPVPLRRPVTV